MKPHTSMETLLVSCVCRLVALVILVAGVLTMPGCIAWEIRDEIVKANTTLTSADKSLSQTNELLVGVREDLTALTKTNEELAVVGERLTSANQHLELLTTIDASLKALDAHLASLRKTLENIDSTIPFLSFAADEEAAASQPDGAASQPDGAASQPTTRPIRRRPPPRPADSAPATQPGG